jgi:hypothetical protein
MAYWRLISLFLHLKTITVLTKVMTDAILFLSNRHIHLLYDIQRSHEQLSTLKK